MKINRRIWHEHETKRQQEHRDVKILTRTGGFGMKIKNRRIWHEHVKILSSDVTVMAALFALFALVRSAISTVRGSRVEFGMRELKLLLCYATRGQGWVLKYAENSAKWRRAPLFFMFYYGFFFLNPGEKSPP